MQQLLPVWSALSLGKRAIIVGATVAVFALILMMGRIATKPEMALLYAGLEPGAAGEVVGVLEQRAVEYQIRADAIYVPLADRDRLRMELAAEGKPASNGTGYELLDSLSGFGTTSQMFDAAYWRAKEGELARTIAANPRIRSARVHIANVVQQPFRREVAPTASVTVTTRDGGVAPELARAFRFLVASAVPGLAIENVTVIDGLRGIVLSGEDAATSAGGIAAERAEVLRRNVLRLVEARVGAGRAVVEVSIETVNEREQISERIIDPTSRVAISLDSEEHSSSSTSSDAPAAGVASNLAEGEAKADGGTSQSRDSETRERTNYEVSQTQREVLRNPGGVKRQTVAVLVDGLRSTDANGAPVWQPLPDAELDALRDLVSSAVGLDASRGDALTLKSMPFDQPAAGEVAGEGSSLVSLDRIMPLAKTAILGLVALALGLFVIRPILSARRLESEPSLTRLSGPQEPATRVLTGEIDETEQGNSALAVLARAEPSDDTPEDPVGRFRRLIAERQQETVEILRGWMEEKEERA